MVEVSPVRGGDPAPKPVSRTFQDNTTKLRASAAFAQVLIRPKLAPHAAGKPVPARGAGPSPQMAPSEPAAQHKTHGRRGHELAPEPDLDSRQAPLDPLWCQMALHPGCTAPVMQAAPPAALSLRDDIQNLLTGLARRVAWGGDRRRGSARIELAEGALAGATLIVHTEHRSVRVEIELPGGAPATQDLQQRILERLQGRGFVASVRIV